MSRIPFRLPMYLALVPQEHVEDRSAYKGRTSTDTIYYASFLANSDIIASTVSISKKCLVIAVGTVVSEGLWTRFKIYRDDVDITKNGTTSVADANKYRTAVLYGTEVLGAGSYTFKLRCTLATRVVGASLEIIAVSC